ncbi:MAG: hypothetical protein ABJ313_14080 [Cyclobacteriaceae bacterium]
MKIDLISKVCSDFEGYEYLIQIFRSAESSRDKTITLIFTKNYWFEANLAAVLGAIVELLEAKGKKVHLYNIHPDVAKVLRKNRFLCDFGHLPLPDTYGTILSYQRFNPVDDDAFMDYIKSELLTKPDFPKHSPALGKKISQSIFELYENARTHGKCKQIHTCGQYYPNKAVPRLDVTIVDMGISIKKNVVDYLKKTLTGGDAIEWAVQYGNTTKTGTISGGLGLDIMFEFVKLNNGKVQIISSDGYWEFRRGETLRTNFRSTFPGTIVNIEFNLNDTTGYYLIEETPEDIRF